MNDSINRIENRSTQECVIVAGEINENDAQTLSVNDDYILEVSEERGIAKQREEWKRWRKNQNPTWIQMSYKKVDNLLPKSPIDAFLYYVDNTFLEKIVCDTNLKNIQKRKESRISGEEKLTFLGINITMTYHQLPSLRNYLSALDDMGVTHIKAAMTRDRFIIILSNLHLNDEKLTKTTKINYSKLDPRWLHDCNSKFIEKSCAQNLSVNESMIKLKGVVP